MIVALVQDAPHPPSWLGLASVLLILVSCAILLLLPNSAWRLIARVARGEDDLGAPFDLDDRHGVLVEATGLSVEPWRPDVGAFASAPVAEPQIEPRIEDEADLSAAEPDEQPVLASEPVQIEPEAAEVAEPVACAPELPAPATDPIAAAQPAPAAELVDRRCKMDMAATKDGLELVLEVPGLDEQDVDIQVSNDMLTISGELRFDPGWPDKTYRLMERDYGAFSRTIELPEGVRPDRIRAALNRGILTVTIPNPTRPEPKRIEIQAAAAPMRVAETDDGLEVTVDMPGFEEDDVEVAVSDGVLTVRGEHKSQNWISDGGPVPADPGQSVFSRSIELPEGVNAEHISAALGKGVLTVRIPYPVKPDARRIPVRAAA